MTKTDELRAQHAELMAVYDKALDNLTAERDALRDALQKIANWPGREQAWPAEGEMIDLARDAIRKGEQ